MLLGVLLEEPAERPTGSANHSQQETMDNTTPQNATPAKEASNDTVDENDSEKQYALPEQTSSDNENYNLTVHFIDVGQGDSIFVEYANETMLVDAGERDKGANVSAFLTEQGVTSLDYVVATHPHADHIGGLLDILGEYPVGEFVDSGYPHTTKTYESMLSIIENKSIPFHVPERGQALNFAPGIQVQVLNPKKKLSEDINENSVVLRIIDNNVSFLLMGDAGLETEESIMYEGYDLDSDILKVGHHGSTSASAEDFIAEVSPEISIIEVGADNDYGHPHAETLERLQNVSTVYRTDLHGTITVTTDGFTYTVTTEKTPPEQNSTMNATASFPIIKAGK